MRSHCLFLCLLGAAGRLLFPIIGSHFDSSMYSVQGRALFVSKCRRRGQFQHSCHQYHDHLPLVATGNSPLMLVIPPSGKFGLLGCNIAWYRDSIHLRTNSIQFSYITCTRRRCLDRFPPCDRETVIFHSSHSGYHHQKLESCSIRVDSHYVGLYCEL